MLWNIEDNINTAILPKQIYTFKAISVKTSAEFLMG